MDTPTTDPAMQETEDQEEVWARENGLPAFTDPPITQYLLGRDKLIQQERKQRSDHAFRESLSPTATGACQIVSYIRAQEHHTVWNTEYEANLAASSDETIFPGMAFSKARDKLDSTRLWNIVKRMPKGALLHCHLEAMVDIDWLVDELFKTGGMHIKSDTPLDSDTRREDSAVQFRWRKSADTEESIWSSSYPANALVPIDDAAAAFPEHGLEGFKSWLKSRLAIGDERHTTNFHKGPCEIWDRFHACFQVLDSIIHYEPIWTALIQRVLKQLLDDGIRYVELRAVFRCPMYRAHSEDQDEDYESLFQILHDQIEAFKQSPDGKQFWDARLIFTDVRSFSTQQIIQGMTTCLEMKQLFPDLIAGYDIVGEEDQGRPLTDLLPELFWFKKSCAEHGVEIPFFFHAGETLGDGTETDENLYDAILLGTRRIGHGFSLHKHPLLMDMIKDKGICIESCPISNEILRLTSSIMTHPLPALLARGVPVALGSDDPAVMGQGAHGMTHEFWQALQGSEVLGLEGLASLAETSIRYATHQDLNARNWAAEVKMGSVGKSLRAQRLREWSLEWEKFCRWVVSEYGQMEESGSDGDHDEGTADPSQE